MPVCKSRSVTKSAPSITAAPTGATRFFPADAEDERFASYGDRAMFEVDSVRGEYLFECELGLRRPSRRLASRRSW